MRPGIALPRHRATTAHLCSAYPFAAEVGLGVQGVYLGSNLLTGGGGFAFEPMPALASLGAGKAALRNLAFSLHAELKDSGIHAATVTICGIVRAGTPFDPDRIAESYWALHAQAAGSFEREVQFRG